MEQNTPSINNLIDELEELVENGHPVVLSRNRVSIDVDQFNDLIAEMRENIPRQIKMAEKVYENCNKTINEASNQANAILEQARAQAQQLVNEDKITELAKVEAERIIDEAYEEKRKLKNEAKDFIKEKLSLTERALNDMISTISSESMNLQSQISNQVDQCYQIRQELLDTIHPDDYDDEDEYIDEDDEY